MDAGITTVLATVWDGARAADLEDVTLDFKTVGRSVGDALKDLAEAAMCFANAQGGTIVVGIQDGVGGPKVFVGSPLDPTRTVSRVYELTEPGLIVIVDALSYQGVPLSVITVPTSPDVHQVAGRATERVGTSCKPMSATRITAVLSDRRGDDWSGKDSGQSLDTVSPVAEAAARDLLAHAPDPERSSWARIPWPDLCRRLGVVIDGRFTNGGALLFTDTGRTHAQYIRRAANSGLLSANDPIKGPGVNAIGRVLELIEGRTERTAILTPGGQQLLIGDLPDTAVREAVVNAFMHRDYRTQEVTNWSTRPAGCG